VFRQGHDSIGGRHYLCLAFRLGRLLVPRRLARTLEGKSVDWMEKVSEEQYQR
jgi:hypothetical protein